MPVDVADSSAEATQVHAGRPGSTTTASQPSADAVSGPPEQQVLGGSGWFWPVLVLSIGGFMSVLDSSIVNVAVPVMQKDFGASTDDIEWVSTAYSLSLGVIVPVSGWLGNKIGMRFTYLVSLIGFAVTSLMCGVAWDLGSMVFFRILQAVPGGVLPVVSMAMLYKIAPPEKIGAAMAVYGLGVVFAPGIGPTLGGYLVDHADWRWVFFINGPAGLIGTVLAYLVVREFPKQGAGKFDTWGFVTVATGLFALLLAVSEGQSWGWSGYRITGLLVGSVLLLALFVVIELQVEEPLINVRVFAMWQFTNSLLLVTALSVGLFAVVFYIPVYLQLGQNRTAFDTGLVMFPEAIAMASAMPLAGILYDRLGPRIPVLGGLAIAAWGTYLLCGINADVTSGEIILWTCIRGAGNGLSIMTIMTAGLAVVPADQVNAASALNNIVQRVSAALGLGILTSLATDNEAQYLVDRSSLIASEGVVAHPQIAAAVEQGPTGLIPLFQRLQSEALALAYSNGFLFIAIFTGAGALLGLLLKKPPPSADGSTAPQMMAH